jgi:hypothetical protein
VRTVLCGLLALLLLAAAGRADEAEAAAKLLSNRAAVLRDEKAPGKPVVGVGAYWPDQQIDDAVVKGLREFPHLRTLRITSPQLPA